MKCVGFERLIDHLDGRLPSDESEQAAAHLESGCSQCAATRAWYQRVRAVMASDRTVEPPPWVLRRAARLFDERQSGEKSITRAASGVVRLIFDSLKQPAMAGARSAGRDKRVLLYSLDDYSIDLQIASSDESRADLIGQVLSTAGPGFESVARVPVALARRGKSFRSTTTDEVGVFVINKLPRGEYDLQIEARDMAINVVGLPVSPSL